MSVSTQTLSDWVLLTSWLLDLAIHPFLVPFANAYQGGNNYEHVPGVYSCVARQSCRHQSNKCHQKGDRYLLVFLTCCRSLDLGCHLLEPRPQRGFGFVLLQADKLNLSQPPQMHHKRLVDIGGLDVYRLYLGRYPRPVLVQFSKKSFFISMA